MKLNNLKFLIRSKLV